MTTALAHPEMAPLLIAAVLTVALCVVSLINRRRALAAFAGPGARLASASRMGTGAHWWEWNELPVPR